MFHVIDDRLVLGVVPPVVDADRTGSPALRFRLYYPAADDVVVRVGLEAAPATPARRQAHGFLDLRRRRRLRSLVGVSRGGRRFHEDDLLGVAGARRRRVVRVLYVRSVLRLSLPRRDISFVRRVVLVSTGNTLTTL